MNADADADADADAELVIYRHMWHGVVLLVRMTNGTELHPDGWTHYHELCPPPPPAGTDFVRLDVGQFLGQTFTRTPADLGITAPGTYLVYAQYWLSARREGDEWHISLRERPIESVPIGLTVRANRGSK